MINFILSSRCETSKTFFKNTGREIGKIFGVPSESVLANQEYFGLQFSLSFGHQMFFGVPIPHFGLPFGTLHTAISHPEIQVGRNECTLDRYLIYNKYFAKQFFIPKNIVQLLLKTCLTEELKTSIPA